MSKWLQGSRPCRWRRAFKRLLLGLATAIPVAWYGLDFSYSVAMRHLYSRWEAGIRRDADGVRRGCREFSVGQGDTALLFIHGFGDSPAVFKRMAPAMAEQGFACRAMRLPHFATPLDSYEQSDAAQWHQAVGEELAVLRRDHARVVIVAHSLGAAVALDYLADHPHAADGVALLAPLIEVADHHSPLMAPLAWFQVIDHTLLFTDRFGITAGQPPLRDIKAASFMKADAFVPRSLFRELAKLVARNRARGAHLKVPLLMVLAGHDAVVDNAAAERFFNDCTSSTKRLERIADAGHIIPVDAGWKTAVSAIARFADDVAGYRVADKARR